MKSTLIVARYEENVTWVQDSPTDSTFIVQKGEHIDNFGREASSYLWYIIENYDSLEGNYFFSQGNPMDHWPNWEEDLKTEEGDFAWFGNRVGFVCKMDASPHDRVDIAAFIKQSELEYEKDTITFNGCALFMASADRIKERPKEFYENMLVVIKNGKKGAYAFERCVGIIFGDEDDR